MKKILICILIVNVVIFASCKKDDDGNPATIGNLSISPTNPGADSPVTISATVTDASGILSVRLFYAVNEGDIILVNMSSVGDTYTGLIPPQEGGSVIKYYIEVVNSSSIISFAPSGAPTTFATYSVTSAPVITNFKIVPVSPTEIQSATVSANIADLKGITNAKLYYKLGNGSYSSLPMSASGAIYSAIIPAQPVNTQVSYYIEATNTEGTITYAPASAPATAANYTVNGIFMNEFWSWGSDTTELDWIELYNNSNVPVNIGGFKLYDKDAANDITKKKLTLPDGTLIPAHGFFTVVVDSAELSGDFGLSKAGEEIWLENANGIVIDNFTFGATTDATQSYGRQPDGSGIFYIFTEKTKNASNNNASKLK